MPRLIVTTVFLNQYTKHAIEALCQPVTDDTMLWFCVSHTCLLLVHPSTHCKILMRCW